MKLNFNQLEEFKNTKRPRERQILIAITHKIISSIMSFNDMCS